RAREHPPGAHPQRHARHRRGPHRAPPAGERGGAGEGPGGLTAPSEAVGVIMAAAANDPGERGGSRAARWLLAPPSCGASLRLPLSLPGSFASLTMITPTDS